MTKKDEPSFPIKDNEKSIDSPSGKKKEDGKTVASSKAPQSKASRASSVPTSQAGKSSTSGIKEKTASSQSEVSPKAYPSEATSDKKPKDTPSKEKKHPQKQEVKSTEKPKPAPKAKSPLKKVEEIKLSGLYAFKEGMSSVYDDQGRHLPVTFLKVFPWFVSQIKNKSKETYTSVQVAYHPLKKTHSKALEKHLSAAGFEKGARYIREIRQDSVENVKVGQKLSIQSLVKGDVIKLRAVSKGHGFSGVVKRWGFNGGPASHGSKTHRMGGSIGNRTEPARVMPGKKMPGHYGARQVTVNNVKVVDVLEKEQMVIVKGPVPGARNSLVLMYKSAGS